jgi:hypothetical protein
MTNESIWTLGEREVIRRTPLGNVRSEYPIGGTVIAGDAGTRSAAATTGTVSAAGDRPTNV